MMAELHLASSLSFFLSSTPLLNESKQRQWCIYHSVLANGDVDAQTNSFFMGWNSCATVGRFFRARVCVLVTWPSKRRGTHTIAHRQATSVLSQTKKCTTKPAGGSWGLTHSFHNKTTPAICFTKPREQK